MSKLAKEVMQTIYIAETRDRIKISDDRDCLPADAIRIETRIFASDADIFRAESECYQFLVANYAGRV